MLRLKFVTGLTVFVSCAAFVACSGADFQVADPPIVDDAGDDSFSDVADSWIGSDGFDGSDVADAADTRLGTLFDSTSRDLGVDSVADFGVDSGVDSGIDSGADAGADVGADSGSVADTKDACVLNACGGCTPFPSGITLGVCCPAGTGRCYQCSGPALSCGPCTLGPWCS